MNVSTNATASNLQLIQPPTHVEPSELDPRGSRGPLTRIADRDVYNEVDSDLDIGVAARRRDISEFSDDYSSAASADIVAETRYRMKGLEKEALVGMIYYLKDYYPNSCK